MNHVFLKFASTIFLVSLAFIFIPYMALNQSWIESVPSYSVAIVLVLALLTLVLFAYLQRIQKSNPQKFIQLYLLSITVKMLVGCVLILVIIFMDREGAIANALLFILSYFLFTGIEIVFLMRKA